MNIAHMNIAHLCMYVYEDSTYEDADCTYVYEDFPYAYEDCTYVYEDCTYEDCACEDYTYV